MDINQTPSQTKVPPPPAQEVSVRTMASDIRAISQGEITPAPEIIGPGKVDTTEISDASQDDGMASPLAAAPKKSHSWAWILFAVIGALAAGAIGYYLAA